MPPAPTAGGPFAGNLAAVAGMALWASAFPITEILLRDWHPLLLAPVRLVVGAAALLVLVSAAGRLRELRAAPLRRGGALGAVGVGGSVLLLVWGQSMTTAVSAGIVSAMLPVIVAILGLFAGERPTRRLLAGIAVATVGGAVASWNPQAGGLGLNPGDALVLASNIVWVWSSRAIVTRLPDSSDIVRACLTMAGGATALSLAAAVGLVTGLVPPSASLVGWSPLMILWMGTMAVGVSFACWLSAVRQLGTTLASIHQNLVPLYVMLMTVTLGGRPEPQELAGAALVVLAATLAQLGRRPAEPGRSN